MIFEILRAVIDEKTTKKNKVRFKSCFDIIQIIMKEDLIIIQKHIYFVLDLLIETCKKKSKDQICMSLIYMKKILDFLIHENLQKDTT